MTGALAGGGRLASVSASTAGARRWMCLLLVAAAYGCGAAGQYWLTIAPRPAWSAWAWGAAAVLFLGSYFLGLQGRQPPAPAERQVGARTEGILLAGVLTVGAFFTFYNFSKFPPGLNHDAAWEGLYALRILRGEPYTPYATEAWGRETLTFYLRAASIWLMGPTALAVIAPSMVFGFLTLPFFYWWARSMFGAHFALLATLLFGASGWHLVFSRTGWRSDFQPFFTVFACCFFIRGMRTARPLDFVLSGAGVALCVNVYNAARVFPALFVTWLLAVWLQSWTWRGFLRRYGVPLLYMAAAFAIVVAPLAWFAVNNWAAFQGRMTALRGATTLGDAVRASLLLFNHRGNGDDFFVAEPALEYPAAVLFVFGVLWALLRWRDERIQFILLGLLIGLLPGLVSRPNLNRNVGTMPFVYFLVALGAAYPARLVEHLLPRSGRGAGLGLLAVACAASAVATYQQYLGPRPRAVWGFYPETTVVGNYVRTLVPNYEIWIGGANYPRDSITYLSYQGTGNPMRRQYTWLDDIGTLLTSKLPAPGDSKGLAFILSHDLRGDSVMRELQQRYPQHRIEELRYPPQDGRIFARALLVPPGASTATEASRQNAETSSEASTPVSLAPPGELREPRGIAASTSGNFYVCDFGHDRIQQFDAQLRFVRQWGRPGWLAGQFRQPCGIAVGPDGAVHVADTWNHRVQSFTEEGKFLRQSQPVFYGPRGLAVDREGRIFVADTGNNRVVRLSTGLAIEKSWGGRGKEPGQFLEPTGIAVGPKGDIFVADNGNGRLQRFTADGSYVSHFPVPGWRLEAFSEPHVVVDRRPRIWLTVPAEREVRIYTETGKLERVFSDQEHFERAMGLALDGRGGVVVTDLANRLVRLIE